MESFTGTERRVRPGKTVSPRPTKLKAWAYKEFKIKDIFEITTTKRKYNANAVKFGGKYPYVVRTSQNNGIRGRIDENIEYLNQGNTISFGQDTATIFYQEEPYFTGDKIKILNCKYELNKEIACYLLTCMRKSFSGFSWGVTSFNENKLKDICITLPITQSGKIDFDYMESRIQEMEESRIQGMEAFLKVSGFEDCELTREEQNALDSVNNIRLQGFAIGDLYDRVELSKNPFDKRTDSRQIPDSKYCIPLVNAKHGDNGIMYYGDKTIFESIDMTIDIVQNGAIATGDVYPQPQPTGILWDAYLIRAIHHQDTTETLMYISAAIRKSIKRKYTYDNKAYWEQVKKETIDLPVTPSGDIDYHFMETYIRAIEKQTIQRVKDWRAKEISATKGIVNSDKDIKPAISQYVLPQEERNVAMVAEDILIYGSLEVRLRNTKKSELLAGTLDLVLMYAISPAAREKTEKAGRIALGIKESNLSEEAVKAYQSVRYIMFHYWKNSEAKPFALTAPTQLVSRADVPEGFMLRQEKEAKQFLLIEYDPSTMSDIGAYDILKAQRRGSNRYLPFVCKVENIQE